MLEVVTASQFHKRMGTGKTKPCLLTCTRQSGDDVEVIAKFSDGCGSIKALASEVIAAMLAADLGLPVPEPFIVLIDDEFISMVSDVSPEITAMLRKSCSAAFGSSNLPAGFAVAYPVKSDSKVNLEAAEIFAFDALIQNNDRGHANPNFLYNGKNFAIFDHEMSFIIEGVLFWQPPWEIGSLDAWKQKHAFYTHLSGKTHNLDRFTAAWAGITNERLKEYMHAMPAQWLENRADVERIQKILDYIISVRENIGAAMTEIARVLS